jgi:hypothetical protein
MITAYYVLNLGHFPDWSAFFEYSVSISSGFFAIPIDPSGPVWTLFLVFCAVSTTAVQFLRGGLTHRALSLIAGTWGAVWAMSSYFVPRSHPAGASLLSPILCIAIGLTLYLLARYQWTDRWAMLVRTSLVPVLAIILTVTFGNAAGLAQYITSSPHASYLERYTEQSYNRLLPTGVAGTAGEERATREERATTESRHVGYEPEINSRLPVMDKSLLNLLDSAQVKIDDPIVYVGDPEFGGILPAWPVTADNRIHFLSPLRTWLPTMPFTLVAPLSDERKEVYMSRFTERARLSGWLIQSKKEVPYTSSPPWFSTQLQQTHTPTEEFENDSWRLTWFEFSGS